MLMPIAVQLMQHRPNAFISAVLLTFQCVIADLPSSLCIAEDCPWLVRPYLQNPSPSAMTVRWVTDAPRAGELTVFLLDSDQPILQQSSLPIRCDALSYHSTEADQVPGAVRHRTAYLHRIRVQGLEPGRVYRYRVRQTGASFVAHFRTAPDAASPIRLIVYADSETEPESTGNAVDWPQPFSKGSRRYVVDQTEGYRQNLKVMSQRNPHLIAIAGDLVEKGGRQLDWDEFWRHNAGQLNNLASQIPILPAVGNHENYAGSAGAYSIEGARWAIAKYQAYFETPDNGSGNTAFDSRYYRLDYGPITWITLDSSDGAPHQSAGDSNFMLLGEHDQGDAPDFHPGSVQYRWLEEQLQHASKLSRFTFVQFHHKPYSIGPHGLPAGEGEGKDNQSGQPLRALSPLFEKYRVSAVFCGHDEIYEHSLVGGVHYYDIGIGGDGLRGPFSGPDGSTGLPSTNPHQLFLAHLHAPEVWNGPQLVDGGKHYGHIEVNVSPNQSGQWQAEILPVYLFPVMDANGKVLRMERRIYKDTVILHQPSEEE
jgi:hypothetical protein